MNYFETLISTMPLYAAEGVDAGTGEAAPEATGAAPDIATAMDAGNEGAGADDQPWWPSDWTAKLAGDDEANQKLLSRYGTPQDMATALIEQRKVISASDASQPMPDGEDEAALKTWRKANGIPDEPTGYEVTEEQQSRFTDADKPIIAGFQEHAHKAGYKPEVVSGMTDWYLNLQEEGYLAQGEQDKKSAEATTLALRDEFGREYAPQMKMAVDFMETTGGIGRAWEMARLPADLLGEDGEPHPQAGKRIGDIPEFVKWAAEEGKAKFGDMSYEAAETAAAAGSRADEIRKIMRTDRDRYNREGLDKELQELLAKEDARSKR